MGWVEERLGERCFLLWLEYFYRHYICPGLFAQFIDHLQLATRFLQKLFCPLHHYHGMQEYLPPLKNVGIVYFGIDAE